MYIAAWTGQAKLLELLQESLPEFEDSKPGKLWADFRSKIGPGSLEGAAVRGDINMVRLALYRPSRATQWLDANGGEGGTGGNPSSMLVLGEMPGSVSHKSKLGHYIRRGMRLARSPEVYRYLHRFLNQDLDPRAKIRNISDKAAAGDVTMVQHLLETGVNPSPKDTDMRGPPLMHALSHCHEDVVDILLEYGADPNECGDFRHGTVLTGAAIAGSMGLLRKLLKAGAKIDKRDESTLLYAIGREHTAMVEMLLPFLRHPEPWQRAKLKYAQDRGLESMADLLEPWVLDDRLPEFQ